MKSSEGGEAVGYDANKKVSGIKRHVGVDVEGNLLAVKVTNAGISDTAGGILVLDALAEEFPDLKIAWSDQGYKQSYIDHATTLGIDATIISRDPSTKGFVILPRRWVVERFFAWITRARRLARDYELLVASAEAMVKIAYCRMLLRRVTKGKVVTT